MDSTVVSTIHHARKDELDGIDAQVSSLRAQIQQLLSRRNDLVPIAGLPDEVLCRLFETVRLRSMTWESSLNGLEWTRLTHVCRRWRNAGLNEPRMWSEIRDTVGLGWLEAHLQRSKSAPITVYLSHPPAYFPERIKEQLKKALSETDRLLFLGLLCNWGGAVSQWFDALGPSAANLHTIAFECINWQRHLPPLCNDSFLKDGAPLLRSLHIQNGKMQWTSPLLAGLHDLVYYQSPAAPAPNSLYTEATAAQIVTSLATMRNLTQLHLKNMRFPPIQMEDDAYLDLPTAHLPAMRELRLEGRLDAIAGLLQHLRIPPSASAILNCSSPNSAAAAALACAFRSLWDCSEIMPSTTYSLRVDTTLNSSGGRITLLPQRVDMSTLPSTNTHALEGVSLDIASCLLRSSTDIVRIVSGLPFLDYVRCIHVVGPFRDVSELNNLLALTPSLEEAVVRDLSAPHFLRCAADLPVMQKLRVHGVFQSVAGLLQQLRIPPSASVDLDCYGGPNSDAAAALAQAVGQLWGPTLVGPSTNLKLPESKSATMTPWYSLRIGTDAEKGLSGSCIALIPRRVDLSALPFNNSAAVVEDAVLDIAVGLPRTSPDLAWIVTSLPFLNSVRCLDVVGELMDVLELRTVLALVPSLEEIVLRDLSAAQFVECLLEENATPDSPRDGPADTLSPESDESQSTEKPSAASNLLPELRRVVFVGANLGAYHCPRTDGRPLSMEDVVQAALAHSPSSKCPPPLCSTSASTADLGNSTTGSLGIRYIEFRECWSIDQAMIATARDRLLPAGVEVEWDGQMLQRRHRYMGTYDGDDSDEDNDDETEEEEEQEQEQEQEEEEEEEEEEKEEEAYWETDDDEEDLAGN